MFKIRVCAVFLGIFHVCVLHAGNIDCVKFLRTGTQKICMKTMKETSPSLVAEIDNHIYYASTTSEKRGGVMFEYNGTDYSLYNRDDTEYELIHWLSGTDELVNGIWRDRLGGTTSDAGPLNFENHGCVWNDNHTGYYSADGFTQYFMTSSTPTLDFGTDWYMEITAQVGEPLGTSCILIDVAGLMGTMDGTCGDTISIIKNNRFDAPPGQIQTNTKPGGNWNGFIASTGMATYKWNEKLILLVGYNRYSINQSRAYITWNGNRYYGNPFDTLQCNRWSEKFYLFRGVQMEWFYNGFDNIYRCGPTTIYDIKIWRKK